MPVWQQGDFNGYAHGRSEIAGEVLGEEGRVWLFNDGVATHRVPMQFAEWNPARGIMLMPNWLIMRLYARERKLRRERYRKHR